jgi:GNAT superfamily N-acetyltransferase
VTVTISDLDPRSASDEDLRAYHELRVAAVAADDRQVPPLTYEGSVRRLTTPLTVYGPVRFLAAREDGRLVGLGLLGLPEEENTGIGFVEVEVHPEHRRRGIGTALLRELVGRIVRAGRGTVFSGGVGDPGAGWPFASAYGFKEVQRIVMQSLDIPSADRSAWNLPVAPGYRLTGWVGHAPEDLVASFAVARQAIQDAPEGDGMSFEQPDWTVERVRAAEATHRERDVEQRVVIAVHEDSGTVAGLTEVEIRAGAPGAMQMDTAVLADHRGHGLGVAMKAELLRRLLVERPEIVRINTTTDATNTHMIAVNHKLGYRTTLSMVNVEAGAEALAARLGAGR